MIGSNSATSLYYAGGLTSIVGLQGNVSAFLNVNLQIAAIARNNGVVTVTTAGSLPVDVNGLTMTVSGVADQSYNGTFTVTSTASNALTYSQSGANSTSTGGTVAKLTGGYVLYPMAEVLGVFDTTTNSIDGKLMLAVNTVPWAANDAVEEPHYYQQLIGTDLTFVRQTTPPPTITQTPGVQYESNVGPGMRGWSVINAAPATNYYGNGGTHTAPHAAFLAQGIWQRTMEMQAGEQSVFSIHCNSHGCGKWNSGYNLFELDSSAGVDTESYQPGTSTLQMSLRGSSYQFSPQAFTAGTINAGTVNATTLNGAVRAAQLPLFGISGSGHGPGAVPDPGPTAGSTRFLREDGVWAVAGSGGSNGPAGGDLSGTYPNPVVGAVHATSGTLDGVTIGATTASTGVFSAGFGTSLQATYTGGGSGFPALAICPAASTCLLGVGAGLAPNSIGFFAWQTADGGFFQAQTYNNGSPIQLGGSALNTTSSLMVNSGAGVNRLGPLCAGGISFCVNPTSTFTVDGSGNTTALSYHETLTTPASSSASCNAGDFTDDANFHYVCTAPNTWKRVALSVF